jgi:hypothetical protein
MFYEHTKKKKIEINNEAVNVRTCGGILHIHFKTPASFCTFFSFPISYITIYLFQFFAW